MRIGFVSKIYCFFVIINQFWSHIPSVWQVPFKWITSNFKGPKKKLRYIENSLLGDRKHMRIQKTCEKKIRNKENFVKEKFVNEKFDCIMFFLNFLQSTHYFHPHDLFWRIESFVQLTEAQKLTRYLSSDFKHDSTLSLSLFLQIWFQTLFAFSFQWIPEALCYKYDITPRFSTSEFIFHSNKKWSLRKKIDKNKTVISNHFNK